MGPRVKRKDDRRQKAHEQGRDRVSMISLSQIALGHKAFATTTPALTGGPESEGPELRLQGVTIVRALRAGLVARVFLEW